MRNNNRDRDALVAALNLIDRLPELLAAYEATGDHDHGRGRLAAGQACPGGDCLVARARRVIAATAPPTHSEIAIYEAQCCEDALADIEGRKPRLVATMEDIEIVEGRRSGRLWSETFGATPIADEDEVSS